MLYVIGSGPAGVSCAHALLARGERVTMIDAGLELEKGIAQEIEAVRAQTPEGWRSGTEASRIIARMKDKTLVRAGKVGRKLIFGSDYPYAAPKGLHQVDQKGASCGSSFSKGGFSPVWGAAVIPYPKEDMEGWPITFEELAPYYRKVMGFMDVTGVKDGLEGSFPLFAEGLPTHRMSRQAEALLKDLEGGREELGGKGVIFGSSRLAVRPQEAGGRPGCAYCGLCMYGCPYDLIFNSALTVEELRKNPGFSYVKGVIVGRVAENGSGVLVEGVSVDSGDRVEFPGSGVFLACGAVQSTKIVMASKGAYGVPVTLRDSQYFMVPFLRFRDTGGVLGEELHTLAQLFIEISDKGISPHWVHLQVYTYNELMLRVIKSRTGPLYPIAKVPAGLFIGRLLLIQGYVHSDHSPKILMTLKKEGGGEKLSLRSEPSPAAKSTIMKVMDKLIRERGLFGGVPLTPMLDIEAPGKSFHFGSSLPMSRSPTEWESDILGRPKGFRRVHVVDSSVLPSLPAPTVTFAVMANAYRIGSEYDKNL